MWRVKAVMFTEHRSPGDIEARQMARNENRKVRTVAKKQHSSSEEFEPTDAAWLGSILLMLVEDEGIDGQWAHEVLYGYEATWFQLRDEGFEAWEIAQYMGMRMREAA